MKTAKKKPARAASRPATPARTRKPAARPAKLRLRRIGIDTYRESVAYLHRECPLYRTEGFQALTKVEVMSDGHRIIASLNVVDDASIVGPNELGLSEDAFSRLALPAGTLMRIGHCGPAHSMQAVRRKINGDRLEQPDYDAIIRDITDGKFAKTDIAAFLVACGRYGLDRDEVLYLTRAMVACGERLDWKETVVVDKHCIGGIPGNRTSMLVVPIVAAHGMLFPKTSSRAITSPAGTADTMEVLARVELPVDALHRIVRRHRGCLAWGGTAKLSPADDILISVERPLSIDSEGQMVASILSKKLAAGSTHLLLDIPVGPTAKVRHMRDAQRLRKLFEYVADQLGMHLEVLITDGRQPIGNGIGPALEARDVMQVLEGDPRAPADLRQKALRLAGRLIEFDPDVRGGQGYAIARDILDSGRALTKMNAIIAAQGRARRPLATPGRLHFEVCSPRAGWVTDIDNLKMAHVARFAGAPLDQGAGVDLFAKLGDKVKKDQPLYRVHANFRADFEFARALAAREPGFTIGNSTQIPGGFVESSGG